MSGRQFFAVYFYLDSIPAKDRTSSKTPDTNGSTDVDGASRYDDRGAASAEETPVLTGVMAAGIEALTWR